MTLGADQTQRFPSALASDSVLVDETPLHVLLETTRRLAGVLRFVGEDGRISGDWSRLLDRDESAHLAAGLSLDLERREHDFLDDFAGARPERMAGRLIELAQWLDVWFEDLGWIDRPWARTLRERVDQVVSAGLSWEVSGSADDGVHDVIAEIVRRARLLLPGADPASDEAKPQLGDLRRLYFALLQSVGRIQTLIQQEWDASLESGLHEPAAALVLAFLQVFRTVQDRINLFTERFTTFYYDDVLRFGFKPAQPDSVHLLFQRDPGYSAPVLVPAGTRFQVGRAADQAVYYGAVQDLTVTGAAVSALKTLRLQRDRLVSPEFEFDYVTRAKVDAFGPSVGREPRGAAAFAPLFGPDLRGPSSKEGSGRIGLAVSSPVLWLKDGERNVTFSLVVTFAEGDVAGLIDQLAATEDEAELRRILGRIFARWVLTDRNPLSLDDLDRVREKAKPLLGRRRDANLDSSASDLLFQMLGPGEDADWEERRPLVRNALIEKIFDVAVSTADGWFEVPRTVVAHEARPGAAGEALTLGFHLNNEDPALVAPVSAIHGSEWPTDAPVLRLTLNDAAPLYPLTLLDGVLLEAIEIVVEVEGVRDIRAYNHLGPLDSSRPFMPFGPLPDLASYIVLAAPELARKHVTDLVIRPEWVGLPGEAFDNYYAGYDADFRNDSFAVAPTIMRDGLWAPGGLKPQRLFDGDTAPQARAIVFDPVALRAQWRATDAPLVLDQNARDGFVRLQLAAPGAAFGHQIYPTILTDSLSAKVRGRKRPMPNTPYTPVMARLTIDYAATARIEVGRTGDSAFSQHVLHLHPFGVEQIHPTAVTQHRRLMPAFERAGHLMIGLTAPQLQGVLTLFFDLRQEAAVEEEARRTPRPRVDWSWLSAEGWRPLEDRRILSDTTAGFLRSGIVALDLPPGLVSDNPTMPQGLYWLRASSDGPSLGFAGLLAVATQALLATRLTGGPPPVAPLPPDSIDLKSASLAGVLSIRQPDGGFDLRPAETLREQRTRIGERLRHKGRASVPWDYERLVLEAFPGVYGARCLSNLDGVTGKVSPGRVLVVVTPDKHRNDPDFATRALRLDPLELDRIEQYLTARASPAARVSVRSPAYELVQVRCRVAIRPGTDIGETLRRTNAAIVNQLSPWRDGGCCSTFDWEIRGEDIEDCVRRIPGVETVTGISMIHVWEVPPDEWGSTWQFEDTAAPESVEASGGHTYIRSQHPWSLALPVGEHFIDVVFEDSDDAVARTGIADAGGGVVASNTRAADQNILSIAGVQIGSTFVVGRRSVPDSPAAENPTS